MPQSEKKKGAALQATQELRHDDVKLASGWEQGCLMDDPCHAKLVKCAVSNFGNLVSF